MAFSIALPCFQDFCAETYWHRDFETGHCVVLVSVVLEYLTPSLSCQIQDVSDTYLLSTLATGPFSQGPLGPSTVASSRFATVEGPHSEKEASQAWRRFLRGTLQQSPPDQSFLLDRVPVDARLP